MVLIAVKFFVGFLVDSRVGICSLAHLLIAHLLKIAHCNEQLWAICSDCSGKMRNCEEIAQVAHDKWAIVSKSLRLLMTKEWLLRLLMIKEQIALLLTKTSNLLKNILNKIIFFVSLKKHEQFAHSLFFKEWCEWIAEVTHDNRETVSKWLR